MPQLGQGWVSPAGAHTPSPSRANPGPSSLLHVQVREGTLLNLLAADTGWASEIVLCMVSTLALEFVLLGSVYTSLRGWPV